MTFEAVMIREREALMAEYLVPPQVPPYSAVPSFDVLATTPSNVRTRFPIHMEELRPGQAYAQVCPGLDYEFLWTHVDNDSYRDDYIAFLRKYCAFDGDALPRDLHVDHLFNRERARTLQLPWVRMVLLPAGVNMSHGAGYEKSRTAGRIGIPGNQRGIDEIMLMKLHGVYSPSQDGELTPAMRAYVEKMAARFGLPAALIERNIRDLLRVAARQPSGGEP